MAHRPPAAPPAGDEPVASGRWIDYVPLDEIAEAHRNPKTHDRRGIRASVTRFGFVEPITLDERTGRLVAGHGRLEQLRALEARQAGRRRPTPDVARVLADGGILVASNRLTERGGWDDAGLAAVLVAVQDADPALLAATGWDDAGLAGLLEAQARAVAGGRPTGDPEALPVITGDPVSAPGDVWQLGPHRLAVGDATDPAVLEALMAGDRATCLFTDPPYGVDYVGKTAAALRLAGDTADGAPQLFADVLEQVRPHLTPGAAFYVCYPGGTGLALPFLATMSTPPWRYRQGLVWCKSAFILGHSDYHFAHEDVAAGELLGDDEPVDADPVTHEAIGYGHVDGPARGRGRRVGGWYGGHAEATVLHFPKPAANPDHPTPKPVGLVTRLITNSTRRGHLVLDPFAGSGSTLIAAQLSGRIARLVEVDPRYADGVCRRWQHLTGAPPVLARTGKPVPFPPTQLVTTTAAEEAS